MLQGSNLSIQLLESGNSLHVKLQKLAYKIDPDDGSTIEFYDPPGMGVKDPRDAGPDYIRPHGMEYIDVENMWVSVKPALRNYLINPKTMDIIKSHPTPGSAPHGIACDAARGRRDRAAVQDRGDRAGFLFAPGARRIV